MEGAMGRYTQALSLPFILVLSECQLDSDETYSGGRAGGGVDLAQHVLCKRYANYAKLQLTATHARTEPVVTLSSAKPHKVVIQCKDNTESITNNQRRCFKPRRLFRPCHADSYDPRSGAQGFCNWLGHSGEKSSASKIRFLKGSYRYFG
jgi:hypothetical protein